MRFVRFCGFCPLHLFQKFRRDANGNRLRMLAIGGAPDRADDPVDCLGSVPQRVKPRSEARPFGRRPDQPEAAETAQQKPVAEVKVQRMAEGQDQMFRPGRRLGHQIGRVRRDPLHHTLRRLREPVDGRINPGDTHLRQGGHGRHDGPPDMPGAPDPQLALRSCEGFDEPTLHQPGRDLLPLCARVVISRLTTSGMSPPLPGRARATSGPSSAPSRAASQRSCSRTTDPPQHCPSVGPSGSRSTRAAPPCARSRRAASVASCSSVPPPIVPS